jgi:hypothetical protein
LQATANTAGISGTWQHLSTEQLVQYHTKLTSHPSEAEAALAQCMSLSNYKHDTKEALRVTFAAMCLTFAKREKFSTAQIGILFDICESLLAAASRSLSRADAQQGEYLSRSADLHVCYL